MMAVNSLSAVLLCLLAVTCANTNQDWWRTSVIYQVYPRSFKDTDGDGIGDLKGIEEKLDYLKDIGVNGVWLSPIFRSPMADFGYDIANFTDIDPIFGTMDDFDDLIKKADTLGLRIILDFVPNHSSDEHEWFKKSIKKIDPFTDYYIWHDGKVNNVSGERIPPNNWLSVFRGPAWEWNEERGQYYYHQFAVKQPDLNFRNPQLVDEMKDAMTFWLDRGVAGFRVDAVPFLFEVTSLQDEPLSNDPKALPDDYLYLVHNYTVNLEETFDMVQQWRGLMEAYQEPERLMMAEAYADFDTTLRYYGTPLSPGAHFPFNFALITDVNGNSTPADFLKATKKWIDDLPPGALSNWVIGNHDNHRVASRFGRELVDGLNMLALLLPGVAVTYNGEEIGMEDTYVSWEQTKDPQALDAGPERYLQYTRDPERTPFQWDDTTSSGFSNSEVTWLPVNPRYPELNVEAQKKASVSHYHVYKLLKAARITPTIQRGDTQVEVIGDHVFAFTRRLQDSDTYVILLNLGAEEETVDLLATFPPLADRVTVYAASVHSGVPHGTEYEARNVPLKPKGSLVLISKVEEL